MFHILSSGLLMLMVLILGLSLRSQKNARLWYAVFFLFCIGIQLLQAVLSMSDFYLSHPHWMHVGTWLLFANGPATWLVINNSKPHSKVLLHFLPCLLAFVGLLTFYQLNANIKPQSYYGFGLHKMLFWLLFLLHWASYLLWALIQKNKTQDHSSRFVTIVYLGCGCYLGGSLITWLAIVFGGYYASFWDMASLLSLALMTAALTCLFIINPKALQPRSQPKTLPIEQMARQIKAMCEQRKLHHQADLSLNQFAAALGFSSRQVSDYLNQHLKTNFKQWLNEQRINDAVELLSNDPAMNITAVGYQVGFNSHATFYRAFKKNTGVSPGDIKKAPNRVEI